MAKIIKFALEMADGTQVRTLDELREHFSYIEVKEYIKNGKMEKWLRHRNLDEIADEINKLDLEDEALAKKVCTIFDVKYNEQMENDNFIKNLALAAEIVFNLFDKKPEENKKTSAKAYKNEYGANEVLCQKTNYINEELILSDGQEKVFENSKVVFGSGATLEDDTRLIFRNCIVELDDNLGDHKFVWARGKHTYILFDRCTIRVVRTKALFQLETTSILNIENCYLENCKNLCGRFDGNVNVRNSKFYNEKGHGPVLSAGMISFNAVDFEMYDNTNEDVFPRVIAEAFKNELLFENCNFRNYARDIFPLNSKVKLCQFENCEVELYYAHGYSSYEYDGTPFENCKFIECSFSDSVLHAKRTRFSNCELINCDGIIKLTSMKDTTVDGGYLRLQSDRPIKLIGCSFRNWSFEKGKDKALSILLGEDSDLVIAASGTCEISGCHFTNMELGPRYLIGGMIREGYSKFKISNCSFENIQSDKGILRRTCQFKKAGLIGTKTITENTTIELTSCKGVY